MDLPLRKGAGLGGELLPLFEEKVPSVCLCVHLARSPAVSCCNTIVVDNRRKEEEIEGRGILLRHREKKSACIMHQWIPLSCIASPGLWW